MNKYRVHMKVFWTACKEPWAAVSSVACSLPEYARYELHAFRNHTPPVGVSWSVVLYMASRHFNEH